MLMMTKVFSQNVDKIFPISKLESEIFLFCLHWWFFDKLCRW